MRPVVFFSSVLTLEVTVEVFVGADRFEIYQLDAVIAGVSQQVELTEAAEFVDPQLREVAFFLIANVRVLGHSPDGITTLSCSLL